MNKRIQKIAEATEMLFFKRILRIAWTGGVSNDAILRRISERRKLKSRDVQFLANAMQCR